MRFIYYIFIVNICLIQDIESIPIIRWFTPRLYPHFETNETQITCGSDRLSCVSTIHSNHPSVDSLLFYGSDLDLELKSLPVKDKSTQWALLHEESPLNNYRLSQKQILNSLFDITATFERNSSFPLTTQFLKSLDHLSDTKYVKDVKQKNKFRSSDGLAALVFVQSNCNVPSDRDRYVHQLMEYIHIDSFGKCLNNKPFPQQKGLNSSLDFDSQEFYEFLSKYKFMITFENAFCDDYISEKLWRSLHLGVIPIYRGSQSITDWLPNNFSAIIVDQELERNPLKLAQIIADLDQNDHKYNEYRVWKNVSIEDSNPNLFHTISNREWSVSEQLGNSYIETFECFVCQQLHRTNQTNKPKLNGCPKPVPALGLSVSQLQDSDEWLLWEYEWNESKDFVENMFRKTSHKHEL